MERRVSVLVLEDEKNWLDFHENKLKKAGFQVVRTSDYKEAKNIVARDKKFNIRAAVIDEILYYYDEDYKELQDRQGSAVLKYIEKNRPDIVRIMVTAKPVKSAPRNSAKAMAIWEKLRKSTCVEEAYFKGSLTENYQPLIDYLRDAIKNKGKWATVSKGDPFFIIADDRIYYVPEDMKHKIAQAGGSSRYEKMYNFFSKNYNNCLRLDIKTSEHTFRLLLAIDERIREGRDVTFYKHDLAEIFWRKKIEDLYGEKVSETQMGLRNSGLVDSYSISEETRQDVKSHMKSEQEKTKPSKGIYGSAKKRVGDPIRVRRLKVQKRLWDAVGRRTEMPKEWFKFNYQLKGWVARIKVFDIKKKRS